MKKAMLVAIFIVAAITMSAKTLVAYYSYTNNVERIVNDLRTQIECDVVEIEPADKGLDYAANNYAIGTQLLNAIKANPDDAYSYPAIDDVDINLDDYDTIIIACPLWWSQMAAPFQSFLFHYGPGMAGKNIGVIVSSASSGISGVVADAKRLIPDGKFLEPNLWIRSSQTSNCHSLISQWLNDIHYSDVAAINEIFTDISGGTVQVFNLSGVKVATINPEGISNLSAGIYVIKDSRNPVLSKKVVVNH